MGWARARPSITRVIISACGLGERPLDESQSYCARLTAHWGEHDTSHSRSDTGEKDDLVRLGRTVPVIMLAVPRENLCGG